MAEVLNPLPEDPTSGQFYLYRSDGDTFTLFAQMEGTQPPSDCPAPAPAPLADATDLYCVQGS